MCLYRMTCKCNVMRAHQCIVRYVCVYICNSRLAANTYYTTESANRTVSDHHHHLSFAVSVAGLRACWIFDTVTSSLSTEQAGDREAERASAIFGDMYDSESQMIYFTGDGSGIVLYESMRMNRDAKRAGVGMSSRVGSWAGHAPECVEAYSHQLIHPTYRVVHVRGCTV